MSTWATSGPVRPMFGVSRSHRADVLPAYRRKIEQQDSPRRWTAKRRAALVLSILRGETSVAEAARQQGLTVAEVEEWRERFLTSAENGLRSKPLDDEALKEAEIKRLKKRWASS